MLMEGIMLNENAAVDWQGLLEDYNSIKKTSFKIPKEMLQHVYNEKKTYKKTGKVFLLSHPTIAKYMKKWGIKCLPKGHRYPSPCLKALLKLGDISEMDTKQIAKQIGFSRMRVTTLLKLNNISYKKLRKQKKEF